VKVQEMEYRVPMRASLSDGRQSLVSLIFTGPRNILTQVVYNIFENRPFMSSGFWVVYVRRFIG
jgi:hypothetical protein